MKPKYMPQNYRHNKIIFTKCQMKESDHRPSLKIENTAITSDYMNMDIISISPIYIMYMV